MAIKVASLFATIDLEDKLTPALRASRQQWGGFQDRVSSGIGTLTNELARLAVQAGAVFGAGAVVNAAAKFDQTMHNIQSVLRNTNAEMETMSKQIREIGEDNTKGPLATAQAFYEIASAVQDTSAQMPILQASIALSEAGLANLTTTTDAVVAAINSYGTKVLSAAEASNIYTRTVAIGVGTMDEFAAAMSPLTSLSATAKISFQELGASMAFLTTKGMTAGMAATNLRQVINDLLSPNKAMKEALDKVTLSAEDYAAAGYKSVETNRMSEAQIKKTNEALADASRRLEYWQGVVSRSKYPSLQAQDNVKKYQEQIDKLSAALATSSDKVQVWVDANGKAAKMGMSDILEQFGLVKTLELLKKASGDNLEEMSKMFGNVRALQAAVVLAGGDWDEFMKSFTDGIDDATNEARKTQLQAFTAIFSKMRAQFEGLAIVIGQQLLPPLGRLMTGITNILDNLDKISPMLKPLIGSFVTLGAALIPLSRIFGSLTGPIGLFATAFISLSAAIQSNVGGIRTKLMPLLDAIHNVSFQVARDIKGIFDPLTDRAKTFGEKISEVFRRLRLTLPRLIGTIFGPLGEAFALVFENFFGDVDVSKVLSNIVAIFNDIWGWITTEGVAMLQSALQKLSEIFARVGDWLNTWLPQVISAISKWLNDAWNWVAENGPGIIENVVKTALQVLSNVGTWLSAHATEALNAVNKWFNDSWNWLKTSGATIIKDIYDKAITAAAGLIDGLGSAVKLLDPVLTAIAKFIGEQAPKIAIALITLAGKVVADILPNLLGLLTTIGQGIGNAARGLIQGFFDGIEHAELPEGLKDVIQLILQPLADSFRRISEINWGNVAIAAVVIGAVFGALKIGGDVMKTIGDWASKYVAFNLFIGFLQQLDEVVANFKSGNIGEVLRNIAEGLILFGGALFVLNVSQGLSLVASAFTQLGAAFTAIASVSWGAIAAGLWTWAAPILAVGAVAAIIIALLDRMSKSNPTPTVKDAVEDAVKKGDLKTIGKADRAIDATQPKAGGVTLYAQVDMSEDLRRWLEIGLLPSELLEMFRRDGISPSMTLEQMLNNGLIMQDKYDALIRAGLLPSSRLEDIIRSKLGPDGKLLEIYTRGLKVYIEGVTQDGRTGRTITRAGGGRMNPGRGYWVGEEGPEFVTPDQSGYVHPAGSGGGNLMFSIGSLTVNGVQNVRQLYDELQREARRRT